MAAAQSRISLPVAATIIVIGVIVGVVSLARYGLEEWLLPTLKQAREAAAPAAPPVTANRRWTRTYRDPILEQVVEYRRAVGELVKARDFDGLDAMAATARSGKLRFDNGSWKIFQFYTSFEPAQGDSGAWAERLQCLQAWKSAKPSSVTARIALAELLTSYAWEARGSGWSNSVTAEGWKLFRQRLKDSWSELQAAAALPEKDPHWYAVGLTDALGQQWSPLEEKQMFDNAVAFEPEYFSYYLRRAKFLMPRWYGKEGDWEAFAAGLTVKPGGAELYARIVIDMYGNHRQIFKETRVTWAQTKTGLAALMARYPEDTDLLAHAAMLACSAEDRPFAREMFNKLGDRIDQRSWKTAGTYEQFHKYAFQ